MVSVIAGRLVDDGGSLPLTNSLRQPLMSRGIDVRLCVVGCYTFDPSVVPIGAVGRRRWVGYTA